MGSPFTDSYSSGMSGISEGFGNLSEPGHVDSRRNFIDILTGNYKSIKEDLIPGDKIVDAFYGDKFISRQCMEKVFALQRSDPTRANDIVIKDLVFNLETLEERWCNIKVDELYNIFRKHGCVHLLEDGIVPNDGRHNLTLDDPMPTLTVQEMGRLLRNRKNRELLEEELEPKRIIDDLLVAGVLTFNDHEDITITCHRLDRVTSLVKYIERDILKKCPAFLNAVRLCNSELEKKLVKNIRADPCDKEQKDIQISLQKQDGCITSRIKVPSDCQFDLSIRIRLQGKDGELTDVEHEVANMRINPVLETTAMECETSVTGKAFSSVVIKLRPYSAKSAEFLTNMVREPEGFKRWLNCILTDDQRERLEEAGLHSIKVEISSVPRAMISDEECHCLLSKQDIARDVNATIFHEMLQDMNAILATMYPMSCFTYAQRKEMKFVTTISDTNEKVIAFRHFLLTMNDEGFCVLEAALRRTGHLDLLGRLSLTAQSEYKDSNETRTRRKHNKITRCTSMSSSPIIEKALRFLAAAGPIKSLDAFLQQLSDTESVNDQDVITVIKEISDGARQTADVLRLFAQLPQSYICRFERFLKETEQTDLLQCLKQQNDLLGDITKDEIVENLSKDEIVENLSFLCGEIDPRLFYNLLPDGEQMTVSSHVRRLQRCRAFFESLLESENCDVNISRFVTQLRQLKLYHTLMILTSSQQSKNLERARVYGDILKHKLLENKTLLMDEVDINMLKATFIDRKILTDQQFDVKVNRGSRRECVVALLKEVLDQGYPAMNCLISALKIAGYSFVAGSVENTSDPVLSCPCASTRLEPQTYLDASFSVEIRSVDVIRRDVAADSSDTTKRGSSETTGSYNRTVKPNIPDCQQSNSQTNINKAEDETLGKLRQEGAVDKSEYIDKWLRDCQNKVNEEDGEPNPQPTPETETDPQPTHVTETDTKVIQKPDGLELTNLIDDYKIVKKTRNKKKNNKERLEKSKWIFNSFGLGCTPRNDRVEYPQNRTTNISKVPDRKFQLISKPFRHGCSPRIDRAFWSLALNLEM